MSRAPWGFLDAVWCITLDTATARHAAVQAELTKVGLRDKTTLMLNKRDPLGGVRGCYTSHQHAWNEMMRQGLTNVLIVEDDVFFAKDWADGEARVADFVARAADWDCLLLGWTPRRSLRNKEFKYIDRVVCGAGTHAYILNKRALRKPLPDYEQVKMPIDMFLMCPQAPGRTKRLFPFTNLVKNMDAAQKYKLYALRPMIAFQRFDGTSATNTRIAVDGKLKQQVWLMRLYGATASTVSISAASVLFALLIMIVLSVLIAVPIVVCRQQATAKART
jgi:GR25 family glycosyltransferase involved in LPS biosynthesis